jgi:hypothetical protein
MSKDCVAPGASPGVARSAMRESWELIGRIGKHATVPFFVRFALLKVRVGVSGRSNRSPATSGP